MHVCREREREIFSIQEISMQKNIYFIGLFVSSLLNVAAKTISSLYAQKHPLQIKNYITPRHIIHIKGGVKNTFHNINGSKTSNYFIP